jgi:hypothetical protein
LTHLRQQNPKLGQQTQQNQGVSRPSFDFRRVCSAIYSKWAI